MNQIALMVNQTNRMNRISKYTWHQYSNEPDFQRLMHLISLIIHYPGLGDLDDETLTEIFGKTIAFEDSLEQICTVVSKERNFDVDRTAIERDLNWLEDNGFFSSGDLKQDLKIEIIKCSESLIPHRYSDLEQFQRLIKIIRFIIHKPFILYDQAGGIQESLIYEMCQLQIFDYQSLNTSLLRKDIQICLKPYQILPKVSMRRGYCVGTGILSKRELNKVFQLLRSQSEHFEDPIAVEIYDIFKERMIDSKLIEDVEPYPVRVIGTRSIVKEQYLPEQSLARKENLEILETAIKEGQLLQLDYIQGLGSFQGRPHGIFKVYPLQILFHNIAWYLGYEEVDGERDGHLYFERLDRLVLNLIPGDRRQIKLQKQAHDRLTKLYKACPGIFMGNSPQDQKKFLSSNSQMKIEVELWFTDNIFKFIIEGTQRFENIQMSPPPQRRNHQFLETKNLFTLPKTRNKQHPNRIKITFPKWSIQDFDLIRWIVSFGEEVKVISPKELIIPVKERGEGITKLYD